MFQFISLKCQFSRIRFTIAVSAAVALLVISGVCGLSLYSGKPISWLTRDPSAVTDSSFCIGIQSNLGIVLWSAATAVCFLGVFILSQQYCHRQAKRFLISSGILCLILCLDDLLMLHEEVIYNYLHIDQFPVYLGYCLLCVAYVRLFWRQILLTDYLLLLLASLFFGLSMTMDMLLPMSEVENFLEDGLKFVGIVFWVAYFSRTAAQMIREGLAHEQQSIA